MLGYDSLKTMRDQIQRFVTNTSQSATDVINDGVNRELQVVAASRQWPQLLRVDKSGIRSAASPSVLSFVGGDEFVPMPFNSARLLSLHLQSGVRGGTEMEAMDPQRFREMVGSAGGVGGIPGAYCYVGQTAQVIRAASGVATAFSSVSGNDNIREVTVRFRKSDASMQGQHNKVVLSGAFSTGVSLGTPLAAGYSIESVSIPAGWVGSFRIQDSVNARIVNWQHYEEPPTTTTTDKAVISSQLIEVWPAPQTDLSLTIHYYADAQPLVADEDTPEIPVSAYLIDQVAGVLLEQNGQRDDANRRLGAAARQLQALSGLHKQDAPRIARPYGGNILSATGVDY